MCDARPLGNGIKTNPHFQYSAGSTRTAQAQAGSPIAQVAIKNLLPGSQVQPAQCLEAYLQVGELTERLGTDITLILDLAVLLLQRVGKSLVTSHVSFVFDEIHGSVSAGGCHHC